MLRVLVCGSRNWSNRVAIRREIAARAQDIEVVIHGAAPGADLLGESVAKELQLDYMGFPAKWLKHGRSAGPIRNRHQLKTGAPNLVLAFHEDIGNSKGTADMVKAAREAGIETLIFDK